MWALVKFIKDNAWHILFDNCSYEPVTIINIILIFDHKL